MLIETAPGQEHAEAWLYLSPKETQALLAAITQGLAAHEQDPEWHCHITDAQGRELTVAIDPSVEEE